MTTSTANAPRRFIATVAESGARTQVALPFDPDDAWGAKDRHYVHGTVGGHGIRGLLAPTALGAALPLGPVWLRGAGVAPGDEVEVVLTPEGPLLESLGADVVAALEGDAAAARLFRSMAPFYRKNFIRWIESAKRPETRAARIAETVKTLADGRIER